MLKKNLAAAVIFFIVLSISGCSFLGFGGSKETRENAAADTPEGTVRVFIESYNELDTNAMLDCIDPAVARPVRAAVNIAGGLLGVKIELKDILDLLPLFASFTEKSVEIPKINISHVEKTEETDDSAKVAFELDFGTNESNETMSGVFEMKKDDGLWYIKNLTEN